MGVTDRLRRAVYDAGQRGRRPYCFVLANQDWTNLAEEWRSNLAGGDVVPGFGPLAVNKPFGEVMGVPFYGSSQLTSFLVMEGVDYPESWAI